MTQGCAIDRADDHRGPDQGVLAQVHRRRAGMGFDAAQGQVEPLLAEGAEHHADGLGLVFENRPLLNMRFKISPHRVPKHRPLPSVADGIERLANTDTLRITLGQGLLQRELTGEHPRPHHAGGKPRAFLVGPHHHFQRRFGVHAQVVEGADHLQPGHHPVAAIELAAGGLGIDMAAGHHRWQLGVAPRATGENIADCIDTDGATGRLAPRDKQVAGLAVEVGQRQPADPAFGRGAEAGKVHQRLPQARAVDVAGGSLQDIFDCSHGFSPQAFLLFIKASSGKPAPTLNLR
ncbi:hypothetical protein D3C81_1237550 [compost metagenome]